MKVRIELGICRLHTITLT